MKEVSLNWLSYYEFQLERLESLLPQLQRNGNFSEEKREKLLSAYIKKIDYYKLKIQQEKMKQK